MDIQMKTSCTPLHFSIKIFFYIEVRGTVKENDNGKCHRFFLEVQRMLGKL